jgi:hypothetical protein
MCHVECGSDAAGLRIDWRLLGHVRLAPCRRRLHTRHGMAKQSLGGTLVVPVPTESRTPSPKPHAHSRARPRTHSLAHVDTRAHTATNARMHAHLHAHTRTHTARASRDSPFRALMGHNMMQWHAIIRMAFRVCSGIRLSAPRGRTRSAASCRPSHGTRTCG